jgi:hypothetical protein
VSQTLCKIKILPAFALLIIKIWNLNFGGRWQGCCVFIAAIRQQDGSKSHKKKRQWNEIHAFQVLSINFRGESSHVTTLPCGVSFTRLLITISLHHSPILQSRFGARPLLHTALQQNMEKARQLAPNLNQPNCNAVAKLSMWHASVNKRDGIRWLQGSWWLERTGQCFLSQLPWNLSPQLMILSKWLSGRYTFRNSSCFYSPGWFRFHILSVGQVRFCHFIPYNQWIINHHSSALGSHHWLTVYSIWTMRYESIRPDECSLTFTDCLSV